MKIKEVSTLLNFIKFVFVLNINKIIKNLFNLNSDININIKYSNLCYLI